MRLCFALCTIFYLTCFVSSEFQTRTFTKLPAIAPYDEVTQFKDYFWTLASTDKIIQRVFRLPYWEPGFLGNIYTVMKSYAQNVSMDNPDAFADQQTLLFKTYTTELSDPETRAKSITGTMGRYLYCSGLLNAGNTIKFSRTYFDILRSLANDLTETDGIGPGLTALINAKEEFFQAVGMRKGKSDALYTIFVKIMKELHGGEPNTKKWCAEL